jgi:hypothetical protein
MGHTHSLPNLTDITRTFDNYLEIKMNEILDQHDTVQNQNAMQPGSLHAEERSSVHGEETTAPLLEVASVEKTAEQTFPAESAQRMSDWTDRETEPHVTAADRAWEQAWAAAEQNTDSDDAELHLNPYMKVEIRVSACEDSQRIEVPLGVYYKGDWEPYCLTPRNLGLWISPNDVAAWLGSKREWGAAPFFEPICEAQAAVDATMKRCRALARAGAVECEHADPCIEAQSPEERPASMESTDPTYLAPLYRLFDQLQAEMIPFILWGKWKDGSFHIVEMGPSLDAAVRLLTDLIHNNGHVEKSCLQPASPASQDDCKRIAKAITASARGIRAKKDIDFACWVHIPGEDKVRCYGSPNAPSWDAIDAIIIDMQCELYSCTSFCCT